MTGLSPSWCTECKDEFFPIEGTRVVDPDEPQFCSDDCHEAFTAAEDAQTAYEEARYTGAPVH